MIQIASAGWASSESDSECNGCEMRRVGREERIEGKYRRWMQVTISL